MTDLAGHLPHRPPFLLVDRVLVREPGRRVVAEKLVSGDGPPLPGPWLVEMLAQAAGFLEAESLHGQSLALAGIQEARFLAPARPGDRLRLDVAPEATYAGVTSLRGAVTCGDRELCTARLTVKRT